MDAELLRGLIQELCAIPEVVVNPDYDALRRRADAALSVAQGQGWRPIEKGGKLPKVGEWVSVLLDRESLGRADLNFLSPDKPRFSVVPAQLRHVDDEGWPTWQRWELASGSPCAILEGDTHWQPLPAAPAQPDGVGK